MNHIAKRKLLKERILRVETNREVIINLIICFVIMIIALCTVTKNLESKNNVSKVSETEAIRIHSISTNEDNAHYIEAGEENYAKTYARYFSEDDAYLLAKIAMAEAEGCSLETKVNVILTVLNRVDNYYFPDTIREVIYEFSSGVYQFTPVSNGRMSSVEPNEECWEAVDIVKSLEIDISKGALYFESCDNEDNWHSRNLEFLQEIDGMRFYK